MRCSYGLAGLLPVRLAAPTAVRFALAPALLVAALATLWPRAGLAVVLALGGWWWGSARLHALDHSALAAQIGTAGTALVDLKEPPRRGRFTVRVRAVVVRWSGTRLHEAVQLAPTPGSATAGARIARARHVARAAIRAHVVAPSRRASYCAPERVGRPARGGLADRLHAWPPTPHARADGRRRAVLEASARRGRRPETLRRGSGPGLHLLRSAAERDRRRERHDRAPLLLLGISRVGAELSALGSIGAYVLAVGPQPSGIRAGIVGALGSLAWLTGRERDRWHALLVAAIALFAWNPYTALDPGFQLSFAAVLSIFVLAPRFERVLEGYPVPRRLAQCIAISTACGLATATVAWLHFRAIPLLTVPANAAAAPVVTPLLALALLAAVLPPVGPVLAQANGWCAAYLAGCARFFGGLPGAQVRSPAAAAGLASGVLLVAAYAWQRGQRAEARLPPVRQRPAEDRTRGEEAA
jgi:competence protein ComEC